MSDAELFMAGFGIVCLVFAILAAIADRMGEPDRAESRWRNR